MRYWYFTYYLTCADGYEEKSDAVISSIRLKFPLVDALKMFRESFDSSVNLTILNVIPISRKDFEYMSAREASDV